MPDALLGLALIAGFAFCWGFLGRTRPGRMCQAALTAIAYLAWLSIIPLIVYFVVFDIREALAQGRTGTAAFVAIVSLTFIPIMIFALIPWNYFCRYMWRKTGLKLPQSERLGGSRNYYEWERER